jgi:hypothetical protein
MSFGLLGKLVVLAGNSQQLGTYAQILCGLSQLTQLARLNTVFFRVHAEPSVSPLVR